MSVRCLTSLALLWLCVTGNVSAQAVGPSEFITHFDSIPNFAHVPTVISVKNGDWSDPQTWDTGALPRDEDIVLVRHSILYDMARARAHTIGIAPGAILAHAVDMSTHLAVGTLQVQPGGTYAIGTLEQPIQLPHPATVVIRNIPVCPTDDGACLFDPFQFGTGILAIDGTVTMHGSVKSPTFLRLATEPKAGDVTLTLASTPSGWNTGDKLILPDTRQLTLARDYLHGDANQLREKHWEELVIQSMAGSVVTLTTPLSFDHKGARDGKGVIRFLPHVGNLTRTISLFSEDPNGIQGHTLFTGRSVIDIRYANFTNLGRTTVHPLSNTVAHTDGTFTIGANQIARYALHMHHTIGPESEKTPENGRQFTLIGNAIDTAPKLGIAIHASHYGLVQDNIVYNAMGAAFVTEDGSESYNIFEHNFAVRSDGSGVGLATDTGRGFAHEGAGFWFRRTANMTIRNNVAANARHANFIVFLSKLPIRYPLFQGADPMAEGQYISSKEHNIVHPLAFSGNEGYASQRSGLELWRLSNIPYTSPYTITKTVLWHNRTAGMNFGYASNAVRVHDVVNLGDPEALSTVREHRLGVESLRFEPESRGFDVVLAPPSFLTLDTVEVQGYKVGADLTVEGRSDGGKALFIVDSVFSNATNIRVQPLAMNTYPLYAELRNVQYAVLAGYPLLTITMGNVISITPQHTLVYSHDGRDGDDFELFALDQAPDAIVMKTRGRVRGSPEEGLTNSQTWETYGIAIGGGMTPCLITRSDIIGFVCPISSTP